MAGERIGRYLIFDEIAAGGMATVHLGRLEGDVGFSRTVAFKRLHPQFAKEPDFVSMFLDEARLAARISHPNVVQTLDVVAQDGALVLVMEYVRGESLAALLRTCRQRDVRPPPEVALAIACGALHGLHAAHEATDANGAPLGLVHRDVSPHNVLVGTDGVARMLDFGIAKAVSQLHTTRDGELKGKLAYMAPEQLEGEEATRRSDVYSAALVLWEALSARRCFEGDTLGAVVGQIRAGVAKPSTVADVPPEVDTIVAKGSAFDPNDRYPTARAMALDLEKLAQATASKVGAWVEELAADTLAARAQVIAKLERGEEANHAPVVSEGPVTGSMPVPIEPRAAAKRRITRERRILGAIAASVLGLGVGAYLWLAPARPPPPPPTESKEDPIADDPPEPSSTPSSITPAPTLAPPRESAKPASGVRRSTSPAKNCDPPFSLGPNGMKIPKPECFD